MDLSSLISTVSGLFAGTVQLGSLSLAGLEIPEKLNWGGAQETVLHKLPGGGRVFDLMGVQDDDITWSGYFQGALAGSRARSMDAIRQAGIPVTLSWPGFTRNVIVTKFSCSSETGGFLLPYRVTCAVVPGPPATATPGLLGSIGQDISNALDLPDIMATVTPVIQTAQTALQSVQTVLPVVGVLTGGSPAFAAVSGALTTANGVVSSGIAATETGMGGLLSASSGTGTPLGTSSVSQAIANLQSALPSTQSLAGLLNMQGPMARASANLTNAS